ncbi:hypothetical protein Ciccas_010001, partial [Cichlidogyrus casuarinus]
YKRTLALCNQMFKDVLSLQRQAGTHVPLNLRLGRPTIFEVDNFDLGIFHGTIEMAIQTNSKNFDSCDPIGSATVRSVLKLHDVDELAMSEIPAANFEPVSPDPCELLLKPSLPICRAADYQISFESLSDIHFPWIDQENLLFLKFFTERRPLPEALEDEGTLRSTLGVLPLVRTKPDICIVLKFLYKSSLIHDYVCPEFPFVTGGDNPIFILLKKIQWNYKIWLHKNPRFAENLRNMIVLPGPLHHQFELVRVASRFLRGSGLFELIAASKAVSHGRCNALKEGKGHSRYVRNVFVALLLAINGATKEVYSNSSTESDYKSWLQNAEKDSANYRFIANFREIVLTLLSLYASIRLRRFDQEGREFSMLMALQNATVLYFSFGMINYARWTVVFLAQLDLLKKDDPRKYERVVSSFFVKLSNSIGSSVGPDFCQESVIRDLKSNNLTPNPEKTAESEADERFFLLQPLLRLLDPSQIDDPASSVFNTMSLDLKKMLLQKHHEFQILNPTISTGRLRNFFTGDPVEVEYQKRCEELIKKGEEELAIFLKVLPCSENDDRSAFWNRSIKSQVSSKPCSSCLPQESRTVEENLMTFILNSKNAWVKEGESTVQRICNEELVAFPISLHGLDGEPHFSEKLDEQYLNIIMDLKKIKSKTESFKNYVFDIDFIARILGAPKKNVVNFRPLHKILEKKLDPVFLKLEKPSFTSFIVPGYAAILGQNFQKHKQPWFSELHEFNHSTTIRGPLSELGASHELARNFAKLICERYPHLNLKIAENLDVINYQGSIISTSCTYILHRILATIFRNIANYSSQDLASILLRPLPQKLNLQAQFVSILQKFPGFGMKLSSIEIMNLLSGGRTVLPHFNHVPKASIAAFLLQRIDTLSQEQIDEELLYSIYERAIIHTYQRASEPPLQVVGSIGALRAATFSRFIVPQNYQERDTQITAYSKDSPLLFLYGDESIQRRMLRKLQIQRPTFEAELHIF